MSQAQRLQLLHTLLERDERRRDQALLAWREAQRQLERASEQSDALVTYRAEYRQRWAAQFSRGAPIEVVRCYHGFVERLEQAIGSQSSQVEAARARVAATQQALHQRELKVATVRRLIQRRQEAQQRAEQLREQKSNDEAAQRQAWRRRSALAA
ncbi:flagellar export protein FliJ [Ideonella livida]|uniref:Flagellar FliJ protein n=1 Tax=Ideonella livida TaxID=2707176 RepID=A0A7C9TMG6_9BURK|nr:flagellar export protein FliJ [Ideonella livida]NDY92327.1 flagellar export protein FliJ [Ideonella livida]